MPQLGIVEMMVVMGVAVLLFGKRLPEVGRSLGKGIIEFKKGLNGITDELDFSSTMTSTSTPSRRSTHDEDKPRSTPNDGADLAVPKFEPPTSAPTSQAEYLPQELHD